MMVSDKKELYYEQDNGITYYRTAMTDTANKMDEEDGEYLVLYAENECGGGEYVLFKNQEPVFASQSIEAIATHKEMVKLNREFK